VLLDANVLLNAAFVEDCIASVALLRLHEAGYSLLVEEVTFAEANRTVHRMGGDLGIHYDPGRILASYVRHAGIVFVPPGTVTAQTLIRKHDSHIPRAASGFDCWVLTDDTELYLRLGEAGYDVRSSFEAYMALVGENGAQPLPPRIQPLGDSGMGYVIAWITPSGWWNCATGKKFTAFERASMAWVYFDDARHFWIAECNFAHCEVTIPYKFKSDRPLAVLLTFDQTVTPPKIGFGVGGPEVGSTYETAFSATTGLLVSSLFVKDEFSIGHAGARDGGAGHQLNGYMRSFCTGNRFLSRRLWKLLCSAEGLTPHPQLDILEPALVVIERLRGQSVQTARMAEL